jgi:kinesin family protein 2/24
MKVVDLLQGSGLQGHCTCFEAAGITTLSALAELDVSHFEALGVKDADDRRKLFFLVQRIKKALSEKTVADAVSAEPSSAGVVKVPEETANGETIETKQSKENHNIINAKRDTETAARTRGSGAPRRHHSQQRPDYCEDTDLDDLLVDTTDDDDEVVEENGDSDYSAGQDDSTSDTSATAVRKSRRIQQKARIPPTKRASTAEAPAKTTKQSEEASQHPPKTATASGNSHVTASRHYIDQTSSAVVDSSKTSTKSGIDSASTKRLSGVATPKSRSTEYRLQQPSSMRTGKQLSTIPSNMSAPMSPLVELPSTLVGGDCDAMKQNARSRSRRRSTSFDHYSVDSGSDNDSRSSNKSDVSRNSSSHHRRRSSSDPRPPLHLQRSSSSSSDKLVTAANKTQRQSLGHRSHSVIEVGSNGPRQSLGSGRLADFPAPRAMSITIQGRKEDNSFKTQIEQLRENANADYELFGIQDEQDDSEMRIRVVIRKRPMSKREIIGAGDVDVIHPLDYGSHGRIQVYQPRTRVDLTKEIDTVTFAFDNVFDEHSTNKILYERCIRNLIPSLFEEESAAVSIFAYGQTGAGKTFTMMGSNLTGLNDGSSAESIDNLGLYYMASLDIFHLLKSPGFESFTVSLSLFEIYGGKLFDLLNDRESVKCLEDSKGRVNFPGLSEHDVPDPEYLLELINLGASNRSTGTTSRNADSSRSHAIMQIHINKPVARGKKIEYSRLTVVDLAGSERGADTATASRATRLEGAEINTSLLALKEVIRAMATGDAMTHVPFRGSKLTQVLKESFVGVNCKSV